MKDNLYDLLNRPMDRREFLKHVGLGMLALTVFGSVVKHLAVSKSIPQQPVAPLPATGTPYGNTPYGGSNSRPLGGRF